MAKCLRCWIANTEVPCSKPQGGSKVDSVFHLPRSTNWVPGIFGNLVVKNKLPPQSGSSLEAEKVILHDARTNVCFRRFVFSRYLSLCLAFLVMWKYGLARKIRLISKFMASQSVKLLTYWPVSQEVKAIRQLNLVS